MNTNAPARDLQLEPLKQVTWASAAPTDRMSALLTAGFVNHVCDVNLGVLTVLELAERHMIDEDAGDPRYLTNFHLGALLRLAMSSAWKVQDAAQKMCETLQSPEAREVQ